jgi:excisionase family DNA binding protein
MNDTNEILSIAEVAANLRCSKAHVYNAINGKIAGVTRLPAICMGRRKLVRRASLDTWKSANEGLGQASQNDTHSPISA